MHDGNIGFMMGICGCMMGLWGYVQINDGYMGAYWMNDGYMGVYVDV